MTLLLGCCTNWALRSLNEHNTSAKWCKPPLRLHDGALEGLIPATEWREAS